MLGKNNGVIALLQAMQPVVVPVHCSGHKLELAYKDAIKNTALAEKVVTMLTGLYYLYCVPLNRTNLKNAFACLGLKKLYPVWAGGSRWIGHTLQALSNFIDGYKAIHLHLKQLGSSREKSESRTKSFGFLKLIRSRDILAMSLFLKDVLTILARVSKKFQEEGSVVADVSLTIKSTMRALELMSTKDGPFLQKLGEFEKCEYPTPGSNTRKTYKLMGSDGQISSSREKLINLLCEKLKTCFEDTVEKIVSATSVANFKQWPLNEKALEDYGDTMMKDIIDHYENVLDNADEARAEWPLLRMGIMEIFSKELESLSWEQVNRRFGNEYPNILNVFDLILALPATSTACEQGFSHMKLVKSNRRTLICEATLSNSLMIKLESPGIEEFKPDDAIEVWFNKCIRRPGTSKTRDNYVDSIEAQIEDEATQEKDDGDIEETEENEEINIAMDVHDDNVAGGNNGIEGYELVDDAEDNSDYQSDYDSDGEIAEYIFNKIENYKNILELDLIF